MRRKALLLLLLLCLLLVSGCKKTFIDVYPIEFAVDLSAIPKDAYDRAIMHFRSDEVEVLSVMEVKDGIGRGKISLQSGVCSLAVSSSPETSWCRESLC